MSGGKSGKGVQEVDLGDVAAAMAHMVTQDVPAPASACAEGESQVAAIEEILCEGEDAGPPVDLSLQGLTPPEPLPVLVQGTALPPVAESFEDEGRAILRELARPPGESDAEVMAAVAEEAAAIEAELLGVEACGAAGGELEDILSGEPPPEAPPFALAEVDISGEAGAEAAAIEAELAGLAPTPERPARSLRALLVTGEFIDGESHDQEGAAIARELGGVDGLALEEEALVMADEDVARALANPLVMEEDFEREAKGIERDLAGGGKKGRRGKGNRSR